MYETRRWLAAVSLCTLIALSSTHAAADEANDTDVGAYILQAEMAMQREDYLMAVREYRKAAEFSDNPKVAQKAAATGMAFGFDEEALRAAKRWVELAPDSDEALVHLAQLQLRSGDVRSAKRSFATLLEHGDGAPDERLFRLMSFITQEDPSDADELMRALAKPYKDSALAQYAMGAVALQADDAEFAREAAQRAIDIEPNWMKAKLLYARALLEIGRASCRERG
mgnify:CR=1 FL=1